MRYKMCQELLECLDATGTTPLPALQHKQSRSAGMSQSTVFVARMLQSLNIKADIFNREECKGAWRELVDTGHSKAHRKAIGGLLTSLMSQIVGGVAKDRGLETYQIHLSSPICFSNL